MVHVPTNRPSDADDIKRQIWCVYTWGILLKNQFKMFSNDIKIQLFKSYICCVYTSQLYVNCTNIQIQKLVLAYNNVSGNLCLWKEESVWDTCVSI